MSATKETPIARDLDGGLLSLEEYNQLAPRAQGYACYMQAARPGSPIPDRNPYPKGSPRFQEWADGAFEAMIEVQDADES
jgi:hypothetical protein